MWYTGHGLIFKEQPQAGTHIVNTQENEYTNFENWVTKMGHKSYMNLFAGFDCCRVIKTEAQMQIAKGDIGNDDIDRQGNLCLQFGCRKGEQAFIDHKNKLQCSDLTAAFLSEVERAKKRTDP